MRKPSLILVYITVMKELTLEKNPMNVKCGKVFVCNKVVWNHKMRVHVTEKPYKCKETGKTFSHSYFFLNFLIYWFERERETLICFSTPLCTLLVDSCMCPVFFIIYCFVCCFNILQLLLLFYCCSITVVPISPIALDIFKSRCYQSSTLATKTLNKMPMENPAWNL